VLAHIERTFTKDGSLGLKLNEVPESGRALVVTVNKGSQGEQHEQAVGMLVKAVAGTDVTGLGYRELLGLLKSKAKERPLVLLFEPPAAQQLAQRGEVVGSGGADSPAGGSRPRSMSKPVRSTSAEQELKRKQRQYSLSHPGFAPAAGTSAAAAASTVSEPAALAAEAKTTATRRGQRQFSLTHPDFAAAAAAMQQVTEED
jgi:hypothetical protein